MNINSTSWQCCSYSVHGIRFIYFITLVCPLHHPLPLPPPPPLKGRPHQAQRGPGVHLCTVQHHTTHPILSTTCIHHSLIAAPCPIDSFYSTSPPWHQVHVYSHTCVSSLPPLQKADPTKPSEGLEYTYARKTSALDHERRSLAHIWEMGGNGALGAAAAASDQLFLTYRQVGGLVCGWCWSPDPFGADEGRPRRNRFPLWSGGQPITVN
jgi:hypothetical protein